ncbi:MAG: hypothetical protein MUO60_19980 [Clostridiaceae bacterium]|nr:hypothetical protein [Clostridiaceae bacterium]
MYNENELKKCSQCQYYYVSKNHKSTEICPECMNHIELLLDEEEYGKENKIDS